MEFAPQDDEPLPVLPHGDEVAEVVRSAAERTAPAYAAAFQERHKAEPNVGWDALAQVFGFLFRPCDVGAPFQPIAVFGDKRSMIPDDLTEGQLDALGIMLRGVEDPEFQARVGDVLWLRHRNAAAARDAAAAYLASGFSLEDTQHWVASIERYERAIRLARQVEPKGDLPSRVLGHLEARVLHYDGNDPLYFSLKVLELLDEFKFGNFEVLAEIAGRIAEASRTSGDFERARSHLAVQARLLRRAGQPGIAEAALCAQAECYVREAEAQEVGGSFIAAHHFWEKAVQAFRDRPSLRPRLPELRRRLAEAGRRTITEMKTASSGEHDISEEVRRVQECFRDLAWDDAFYQFAVLVPVIHVPTLRQETLENLRTSPLRGLFKAVVFDHAGRTIAVRPPLGTGDPKQEEVAIEGLMDETARVQRHLLVHMALAPALHVIRDEHVIDDNAVAALIEDSAFIPEDRLSLFVRAIVAGFRFDFSTALHLLVPQAENALRILLEQQGVVARNIDQNGVEEVWSLNRVLDRAEMVEVLGEDLTYELRSLLAGRLGPNLRNLIAHGLINESSLNGEAGFYLWWLLVRMVAFSTDGMAAWVERQRAAAEKPGKT